MHLHELIERPADVLLSRSSPQTRKRIQPIFEPRPATTEPVNTLLHPGGLEILHSPSFRKIINDVNILITLKLLPAEKIQGPIYINCAWLVFLRDNL
jgi:hypothetical protein